MGFAYSDGRDIAHAVIGIGRLNASTPEWSRGLTVLIGDYVEAQDGDRMVAVAYVVSGQDAPRPVEDWWMCLASAVDLVTGAMPAVACGKLPRGVYAAEHACVFPAGHLGKHGGRL